MNLFLMLLLGCLALIEMQTYSQNDYKLVFEHIELKGYNKSFFYYMYAKNTKLNRTQKAIDIGFRTKVDLYGDNLNCRLGALQFFHNEYRRTPILFDVKFCDALKYNTFGIGRVASKNGNLTLCPLRKGTYLIHGFVFDGKDFPPYAPRGRYQIQLRIVQGEVEVAGVNYYGSVEDLLKY